jgi:hypothetical protein
VSFPTSPFHRLVDRAAFYRVADLFWLYSFRCYLEPILFVKGGGICNLCGLSMMSILDLRHFLTITSKSSEKLDSEKERCYTSVISALERDKEASSNILAHALVLRSQNYVLQDPNKARIDALRAVALDPLHPNVWRILADIEEERNDFLSAIDALNQWALHQPHFSSKIKNEISRLKQLSQCSTKL